MKVTLSNRARQRLLSGHPWIFQSDLLKIEAEQSGVVDVYDEKNAFLAKALFSKTSQISLRILTRHKIEIDVSFWKERIKTALDFRKQLPIASNAYRVVFSESDLVPSLIVDRYADAISFQCLSAGLESVRNDFLQALKEIFGQTLIVERSDVSVRQLEGLPLQAQVVSGTESTQIQIEEDGLKFEVDLIQGQKTGAFLDQRDNRILAGKYARDKKRILDAFSYQGFFACHLAKNSRAEVIAVDQSEQACAQVLRNAALNNLQNISVQCLNVFDYLKQADREKTRFDFINLDPPAFIKNRKHHKEGIRGYKEINLRALKLLEPNGILVTSSCSHGLPEEDLFKLISEAAHDAKRQLQLLAVGHQAPDHPVLLGFEESNYLKCLFLRVL